MAAAVAWVRALLRRGVRRPSGARRPDLALPPWGSAAAPDESVSAEAAMVAAAQTMTSPPALFSPGRRLGLSPFERNVLLLCAAVELDTSIAGLCARAQGDPARPYPDLRLGAVACSTIRPGTCCRPNGRCATGGWSRFAQAARDPAHRQPAARR